MQDASTSAATLPKRPRRPLRLDRGGVLDRYNGVRATSVTLCEPLSPEDMVVQVALEASPAKWHLAHTTWFFETFILEKHERGFEPYNEAFRVLFNSYYNAIGPQHPRPRRGVLTRPGVGEVFAYRQAVDERMARLVRTAGEDAMREIAYLMELGLQHEQQHQELLVTDVKLMLHANPLAPSYFENPEPHAPASPPPEPDWLSFDAGVVRIGHDAEREPDAFHYDNEAPRHRRFVESFELANRPVTNAEFLEFVEDGGYEDLRLWLDDAWTTRTRHDWTHPLYWHRDDDGRWHEFTMNGRRPLDPNLPLAHVSFYEADAFARWAGARLPTEFEWEHAATTRAGGAGQFVESGRLHPGATPPDAETGRLSQVFGDVWEWTRSAYEPYPGYAPPEGAVGEYNGKFMCNQIVLRGGSCATPRDHLRATYRNFFYPDARWQFAGLRLARNG